MYVYNTIYARVYNINNEIQISAIARYYYVYKY